jgi:hypothetical protein
MPWGHFYPASRLPLQMQFNTDGIYNGAIANDRKMRLKFINGETNYCNPSFFTPTVFTFNVKGTKQNCSGKPFYHRWWKSKRGADETID